MPGDRATTLQGNPSRANPKTFFLNMYFAPIINPKTFSARKNLLQFFLLPMRVKKGSSKPWKKDNCALHGCLITYVTHFCHPCITQFWQRWSNPMEDGDPRNNAKGPSSWAITFYNCNHPSWRGRWRMHILSIENSSHNLITLCQCTWKKTTTSYEILIIFF